jgi:hypothetical protein
MSLFNSNGSWGELCCFQLTIPLASTFGVLLGSYSAVSYSAQFRRRYCIRHRVYSATAQFLSKPLICTSFTSPLQESHYIFSRLDAGFVFALVRCVPAIKPMNPLLDEFRHLLNVQRTLRSSPLHLSSLQYPVSPSPNAMIRRNQFFSADCGDVRHLSALTMPRCGVPQSRQAI